MKPLWLCVLPLVIGWTYLRETDIEAVGVACKIIFINTYFVLVLNLDCKSLLLSFWKMQGYVVLSCKSFAYSISTHHSAPDLKITAVDEMKCAKSALFFCEQQVNSHPGKVQNTPEYNPCHNSKRAHVIFATQQRPSVSLNCCSQGRPLRLKLIKPWCVSLPRRYLLSSPLLSPPPPSALRSDWSPRAAARILIGLALGVLTPR